MWPIWDNCQNQAKKERRQKMFLVLNPGHLWLSDNLIIPLKKAIWYKKLSEKNLSTNIPSASCRKVENTCKKFVTGGNSYKGRDK